MKDLRAFIAKEREYAAAESNPVVGAAARGVLDRLEEYLNAEAEPGRFVPHWIEGGVVVHLVDTHSPSRSLCGRWIDRDSVGATGAPPGARNCKQCGKLYVRLTA